MPRIVTVIEIERRMVVARGWEYNECRVSIL